MKKLLALVLLLVLSCSVSAKPIVASLNPYSFSFDLKAAMEPTVTTGSEKDNGSISYFTTIKLENKTAATINIVNYNDWQDATLSSTTTRLKATLMNTLNESGEIQNQTLFMRSIDGNNAEVQSYVVPETNSDVTIAVYWKGSKNCECGPVSVGKTKVEILSTLPRDLNENLLDSLNITAPVQPSNATATIINPTGLHKPNAGTPVVDASCMDMWTDLGYASSQIKAMGWCVS
jgi:hypothetical protein